MVNSTGQIGSSISALMREYSNIAHNLANINTTGFKRKVNSFSLELKGQMSSGPEQSPISGAIRVNEALDFSPGTLLGTSRPLDTCINGKGFFEVETPDGPLYTRNGIFQINSNGQLVDLDGRIVAGTDGPIVIPGGVSELQINIAEDGEISADGTLLGKLKIVDFKENEQELIPTGKNCFMAPEGVEPGDAENAMIRQGYRENSNVQRMEELVNLIAVSRLYEMNMGLLKKRHENAKAMIDVAKS